MPKTGGTSVRQMFNEAFNQKEIFPTRRQMQLAGGYLPMDELLQIKPKVFARKRLVRGHYPFIVGESVVPKARKMVFLRKPADRAISFLHHAKRKYPDLSLEEILESRVKQTSNRQVQFFADNDLNCEIFRTGAVDEQGLERAVANLEKCWFVGITEHFSRSMSLCREMMGLPDGQEVMRNVGSYKKEDLPEEIVSRIEEINELDNVLYLRGLELFESLAEQRGI
ncbi:MAG: hypothetical protein R2813_03130 [Flavobacteriales bacterium]